jgi:hypothetical protein
MKKLQIFMLCSVLAIGFADNLQASWFAGKPKEVESSKTGDINTGKPSEIVKKEPTAAEKNKAEQDRINATKQTSKQKTPAEVAAETGKNSSLVQAYDYVFGKPETAPTGGIKLDPTATTENSSFLESARKLEIKAQTEANIAKLTERSKTVKTKAEVQDLIEEIDPKHLLTKQQISDAIDASQAWIIPYDGSKFQEWVASVTESVMNSIGLKTEAQKQADIKNQIALLEPELKTNKFGTGSLFGESAKYKEIQNQITELQAQLPAPAAESKYSLVLPKQ